LYVQRGLLTRPDEVKRVKSKKVSIQDQKFKARITKDIVEQPTKKRKLNNGVTDEHIYDIWEEKENSIVEKIKEIPDQDPEKSLVKIVRPPKREKPSGIDAVEILKPGSSYNPSYEDHQILLKEAVDEQMKKRKEFDRVMNKFKRENPREIIKELDEFSSDDDEEEDSNDNLKEHINIPIIPRLSTAQRNREKRRKIHEAIVNKNLIERERKSENVPEVIKDTKDKHNIHNEKILERHKKI